MSKVALSLLTVAVAASAAFVSTAAAADSLAETFPEFAGCLQGSGVWYKAWADRDLPGHRVAFIIKAGVMNIQNDWYTKPNMSALRQTAVSRAKDGDVVIMTGAGSSWKVKRKGDLLEGVSRVAGYSDSKLEIKCNKRL